MKLCFSGNNHIVHLKEKGEGQVFQLSLDCECHLES